MSLNNRIYLFILSTFLLAACGKPSPVEQLKWLEGNWKQVNQKGTRLSLENWKYSNGELKGKGYTVDASSGTYDTLFIETLRIIIREQTLFYEADLPTQDPVLFRLTEEKEDSWVFSNPKHDFPKYIQYKKTEKGFNALVGDGKRENSLEFEKL